MKNFIALISISMLLLVSLLGCASRVKLTYGQAKTAPIFRTPPNLPQAKFEEKWIIPPGPTNTNQVPSIIPPTYEEMEKNSAKNK